MSRKVKVLFVDDDRARAAVEAEVIREDGRFELRECEVFEEAEALFEDYLPDIVILDLFKGNPADMEVSGVGVYDFVWSKRFCPIVIYSASPDALEAEAHPFVLRVKKGTRGVQRLKGAIDQCEPLVNAMQEVEEYVRRQYAIVLRDVAPYVFSVLKRGMERNEAILRLGRRRLASMFDVDARVGASLSSWEEYIYPAVEGLVLLGDVLREQDTGKEDASNFRVVISPSCDLVKSEERKTKIDRVLVARCFPVTEGYGFIGLTGADGQELGARLRREILSQGYYKSIIPFPHLPGKIPEMVASLRHLELIDLDDGESGVSGYDRVASVDSPFRELIAWAYTQTAARPGLPDRDLAGWAEAIESEMRRNKGQGSGT